VEFLFGKTTPAPTAAPAGSATYPSVQHIPAPTNMGAGFGTLPLLAGTIIPHPSELKALEALGWKQGDPIPTDLAARLQQATNAKQAEIAAVRNSTLVATGIPVSPDTPPLVVPDPMDISALPPGEQAKLIQHMAEAKEQAARLQRLESLPPNIREAVMAMESPDAVALTDVPGQANQVPTPPKQESAAPNSTKQHQTAPHSAEQHQTAPHSAEQHRTAPNSTTAELRTHCRHCGWPSDMDDITPTDEDKYLFLQSALGHRRFLKEFTFLGGALKVIFRTLKSSETDMALEQVRHDVLAEKITTQDAWFSRVKDYRFAMSVDSISTAGVGLANVPEIGSVNYPPRTDGQTHLVDYHEQFIAQVMPVEQVRRGVGQAFERFQRIVDHLEAHMDDKGPDGANFWKGIG
jgi:hypothetical protein